MSRSPEAIKADLKIAYERRAKARMDAQRAMSSVVNDTVEIARLVDELAAVRNPRPSIMGGAVRRTNFLASEGGALR